MKRSETAPTTWRTLAWLPSPYVRVRAPDCRGYYGQRPAENRRGRRGQRRAEPLRPRRFRPLRRRRASTLLEEAAVRLCGVSTANLLKFVPNTSLQSSDRLLDEVPRQPSGKYDSHAVGPAGRISDAQDIRRDRGQRREPLRWISTSGNSRDRPHTGAGRPNRLRSSPAPYRARRRRI